MVLENALGVLHPRISEVFVSFVRKRVRVMPVRVCVSRESVGFRPRHIVFSFVWPAVVEVTICPSAWACNLLAPDAIVDLSR